MGAGANWSGSVAAFKPMPPGSATMPTIFQTFGLRVVIDLNDHRPAHVHVQGKGCEAVFALHCPDGPPEVRENYGFSRRDLSKIAETLSMRLDEQCLAWKAIHGNF